MQVMTRSVESSSIGTVTNLDWPTRMTEAMMSIAYRRTLAYVEHIAYAVTPDLSTKGIALPLVVRELREAQDELGQSSRKDSAGVEVAAKDQRYRTSVP